MDRTDPQPPTGALWWLDAARNAPSASTPPHPERGGAEPDDDTPTGPPDAPAAPRREPGIADEAYLFSRILQVAGLLVLLVATGFFLDLTLPLLSEQLRVALGLAVGTAVAAIGARLTDAKRRFFGDATIAFGGSVAFLSIFAAGSAYALVPKPVALVALAAVTTMVTALAARRRSEMLAVAGLLGGFGAPLFLDVHAFDSATLCVYLAVVAGGFLTLGRLANFRYVELAASIATACYLPVFVRHHDAGDRTAGLDALYATVLFGELAVALRTSLTRATELLTTRIVLFALSIGAIVGSLEIDLAARHTELGAALIALGAVVVLTARLDRATATLRDVQTLLGLGALTVAFPALVGAESLAMVWSIESAVVVVAGARVANPRLTWLGVAIFALAVCDLVVRLAEASTPNAFVDPRAAALIVAGLAGFAAGVGITRSALERDVAALVGNALCVVANLALLVGLSLESSTALAHLPASLGHGAHPETIAHSIVWTIYGVGLLLFGIRKNVDLARYAAIGLLLLTTTKVFTIDLAVLDITARTIATFVLGLGLVAASVLYARIAGRTDRT